jgi:hypothetical protein
MRTQATVTKAPAAQPTGPPTSNAQTSPASAPVAQRNRASRFPAGFVADVEGLESSRPKRLRGTSSGKAMKAAIPQHRTVIRGRIIGHFLADDGSD